MEMELALGASRSLAPAGREPYAQRRLKILKFSTLINQLEGWKTHAKILYTRWNFRSSYLVLRKIIPL
jgi:hypothetical protein